jgi:hypothetical protein
MLINAHWPVITPDAPAANKNNLLVLCKSTYSHFHHFSSSRLPPPRKPQAMADKGKKPCEENNPPPKKQTIRE